MTPNVGDTFRQFLVLEKVGEGGMGEVFRARDTKLDRGSAAALPSMGTGCDAKRSRWPR
jgi:serine/threonine protein kinase